MKRKIVFLILFVLSLIILSSCTQEDNSIPVYEGYNGLELEFSKTTPDEVYENTSFYSRVIIENQGSYSVNNDDSPAFASLTTDKLYLQHDPWPDSQRSFYIIGRSSVYPQGDSLILDLPELRVPKTEGNLQNPNTDLFVNLCYPYRTTFSKNVCLDFDLYGDDERAKVCTAQEFNVGGGQGAPIAITNVVPLMKADENQNLRPEFIFTIENKGSGTVAFDASKNIVEENSCLNANQHTEYWNKVKVFGTISNVALDCSPKVVRLIDGKADVRCVANESLVSQTNFFSPLTLNVDYLYIDTYSKSLDIIRDKTFEDISYTVHQNCKNKQKGDSCGTNMICNEYQQCVDKCSYCSEGGSSIPDKVDCTGITADFSCSCSSLECESLNKDKCKPGYCEIKQCCNPEMDSRPLGAAYSVKEEDEENYGEYETLTERTKLEDSIDYRFKPVHPQSNVYCGLELYTENLELLKKYDGFPKPCSSEDNYLNYDFSISDRGQKFNLVIKTFNEHNDATPLRTETILFEVNDPTPDECDREGQFIGEKVCHDTEEGFIMFEKCEYCNIDDSKNFCQNVNFVEGMGCDCENYDEYHIFTDPGHNMCSNNKFCCIFNEEYDDYEFYIKLYVDNDIVINKVLSASGQQFVNIGETVNYGDVLIKFGTIPTNSNNEDLFKFQLSAKNSEGQEIFGDSRQKKIFADNEYSIDKETLSNWASIEFEFNNIENNIIKDLIDELVISLTINN